MGYIGNQPAETPVVEILETDFKIGEDDQTKIDFADANNINFHADNAKEMVLSANALTPGTSDGTALGTTSLMWSDIFLASGSVINLDNGDVTLTHSANTLTVAGGTLATAALTSSTITASGIIKTDDSTNATSTTDGSLQTDGGLSVVLDAVFGDDVSLLSDSAVINMGAGNDVTFTHDGTTGLTIAANPITLDSGGDITFDAAGNDFSFQAGGTEVLKITNSSSDVIIKPIVDAKDLIFQQRDGTEVARVEDNGTFNIVTDKLAINGTAVTATAAELNLIDGGTSVGGSVTVGDSDGFILNDGGTMKTIPASDVKTYAGGSGSIYTLKSEITMSGSLLTHSGDVFEADCDYFITITLSQASQSGTPYPYILFYRDGDGTNTWDGTSRFVSQTHGEDEDTLKGSPGNKITLSGSDAGVHQTASNVPGYFGQFFFHTPRNTSGTNQATDYACFQGTAGWYDMGGKLRNTQIWCGFGSNGTSAIQSFTIEAAAEYPDTDGGKGASTHGGNSIGSNGWEGMIRIYKIDHS